jgi:predicted ATPase
MGRLLARLVNSGVKVLITTHSDYLIRELNNCIMLHNDIDKKAETMKKSGLTDDDIINPERVKAFVIKKDHLIHEVTVDRYGMNLGIFDELIAEANTLSDDIYYNIKE